jgi:hypothetical protein
LSQQSAPSTHAAASWAQHWAEVHPIPAQHCALLVHATFARPQHCPPAAQLKPVQQGVVALHASPATLQHVFDRQLWQQSKSYMHADPPCPQVAHVPELLQRTPLPQHASPPWHAWPRGQQHLPFSHESPEQQSLATAQLMFVGAHVDSWHVPFTQLRSWQHSPSTVQLAPDWPQPHTPALQRSGGQQSASDMQLVP